MSEAIIVAIIVGSFNLLGQVISRLLSYREHKQTAEDVRYIKQILNSK